MTNLFMEQVDSIGLKIKKIRELKSYTQEYMAEQLEVSQSTYARFEKEDADLSISKLKKIALLLNITVEELINFDEKIIFNNYAVNSTQVGKISHYTQYPYELIELYKDKITLYKDKVKLLEDKILFLEGKLK